MVGVVALDVVVVVIAVVIVVVALLVLVVVLLLGGVYILVKTPKYPLSMPEKWIWKKRVYDRKGGSTNLNKKSEQNSEQEI